MISTSKITTEALGASLPQDAMAKSKKLEISVPARPSKAPPMHPGEIIGGILEDVSVSVRSAATAMGVSHNALANLVRGDTNVTPDMAVRLGAYMKNGDLSDAAEFWLRLQLTHDLWHAMARLHDDVKAITPCPRPELTES